MSTDQILDQVILVDERDQELGVMDKIEAHRGSGKLHRASSVLLHNNQGQWLIQKRSHLKIVGALQWANTCCGNVRPGETYLECAHRRLYEELGITGVELTKVDTFIYQVQCNDEFSENEIDTVFIGAYDGSVEPNPDEVAEYRWLSTEELIAELEQGAQDFAPWLPLVLQRHPQFVFTSLSNNHSLVRN